MAQTELHPIRDACRHMRGRYKLQTSHRSPFPEKRFVRYECERGHEIDNASEEELEKCFNQQVGCWKEGDTDADYGKEREPESEPESE